MKFSFRPALALLLGVASATGLASCDYASLSPGDNPQFKEGFANPPGYTNADINADSINYKQNVHPPIGVGSATAIKNGSVDDQLNSAPGGDNATSPQSASGKMGPTSQNMPNKTRGEAPTGNANGNNL